MPNFNWPMKRCACCHRWLARDWNFARERSAGDGLNWSCRECRALRQATQSQNQANVRARSHSKLGIKGVYQTREGRFGARITVGGNVHRLGIFTTTEAASAAYARAAVAAWGEYARVGADAARVTS
jgi:hypothetical protein